MSTPAQSRSGRTLALALLTLVLLSGCAAEEEPTPIFAEPSATPTPSASAPEKDPRRSPKALIRHWNDLQNEMQLGDTQAWREFTPNCESCIQAADQVDDFYAAGGFIRTVGRNIRSIAKESGTTYRVTIDSHPTEFRRSAESSTETLPGGEGIVYRVHLVQDESSWAFWDYAQVAQ